jgi:hypothetical protein
MFGRKRRESLTHFEAEKGGRPAKRPSILGTDPALTITAQQAKALHLSYWDLWFVLVAVKDCGGNLDRLATRLGEKQRFVSFHRRSAERKRSHLRDLKRRLEEAAVNLEEIISAAGDLARTELRRARSRVLEHSEREREWSVPMRETPRKRRMEHALRGFWSLFPVSPEPYAAKIGSHFRAKGVYSQGASFRLSSTLDRYVDQAKKLLVGAKHAQAQALLRGWMTVVIELMEKADDSFGSIGMSFKDGFATYLKIPLDETGIDEEVFFSDLLDFLIWEDYGLTNDQIEGYFRGLNERQADSCVEHLRRQVDDLRVDDLEYQSEEALTLLGQVVAEQERFDEFEDLARQMGSRAWRRIIRLADRAMKWRKKPLAIKVFEAALAKGEHLEFLTKKFEQLKQGKWNPDPRA